MFERTGFGLSSLNLVFSTQRAKSLSAFAILISVFLLGASAFAVGDSETHGGHVVICGRRDPGELLDLFESRRFYRQDPKLFEPSGMWPDDFNQDYVDEAVSEARTRARRVLGKNHPFLEVFNFSRISIPQILRGPKQPVTRDWGATLVELPAGCKLSQLATYSRSKSRVVIEVDELKWIQLDLQDKTALVIHELIHDWFRQNKTTLATRQAVIYLTASRSFRERNANLFRQLVTNKKPVPVFQ